MMQSGGIAVLGTALSLLSTVLGLAVGYLAFRAYRQSGKRPMLYVAVGFVLAFWVPTLLVLGPLFVPVVDEFVYGLLGEASQVVGLLCILYGLWTPEGR